MTDRAGINQRASETTLLRQRVRELSQRCHEQEAMILAYRGTRGSPPLQDHEFRELVNGLRDIAEVYGQTGQLRERIAALLREKLNR